MNGKPLKKNKNQADRARQGIVVFSGLGQRDLFASSLIESTEIGWRIRLRNPWYTGTHLSTLAMLRITVNDHVVAEASTLIALRGQTIPCAYAKNLHEIWWGMGEVADVYLTDPSLGNKIAAKNEVEVAIDMRTTFSYGFPDDTLPYRFSGELESN